MFKKFGKKNKSPQPEVNQPRDMKTINEGYGKAVAELGQVTYQISVFKDEVSRLTAEIRKLNYEAASRQALDRAAAESAKPVQPKADERQEVVV